MRWTRYPSCPEPARRRTTPALLSAYPSHRALRREEEPGIYGAFSDPIADGPVIQAASYRALQAETTCGKVLELVARLRSQGVQVPLVLMGYLNPVLAMGVESLA